VSSKPRSPYRILAVNPGSTSTKVSLFLDSEEIHAESIHHGVEELAAYRRILDQAPFRESTVRSFLLQNAIDPASLSAVIGRGGLMRPIESGVYAVNDAMIEDLTSARFGEHASNLGAIIAARIAADAGCPAYIADPVVVDELEEAARLSGIPEIERRSIFHALNQKSAAREAARRRNSRYEELNMIVAHLGGGVSVGAHRGGRVVDVNNALDGDGPLAPERSGGLPAGQLVELALSGSMTPADLKKRITGRGGLVAYCGTNDLSEIERRMDAGDTRARAAFEAMIYQISKEIATHGATLSGKVDLIVLTGGMAWNKRLVEGILRRVSFLAPAEIIPGEREMISLAEAARSALCGDAVVRSY